MNGAYCYCTNCPGNNTDEGDGTCHLKPGGQCFSAVEETYDEETKSFQIIRDFGCISADDHALLQCHGDLVPSFYARSIKCCNYPNSCNKDLLPHIEPRASISSSSFFYEYKLQILTFLASFTLVVFILLIFIAYIYYKTKKEERSPTNLLQSSNIQLTRSRFAFSDFMSTSGSGVGKPLLVRTSISRLVDRHYWLGRGRFTEVYLVHWNSTRIIEKVFLSQHEGLWFNERKVYETAFLRHDNILGYISSDVLKTGLKALYVDYHELGSLHDYLDKTCLNYTDFLRLVRSAATAIAHLHTEILGTSNRPAVAHCDITSKNFFINNGKECVISNFQISVTHISIDERLEKEADFTFATQRYLAPEVVNDTLMKSSFTALKMVDIYSLGLVFYEISQRCATIEGNRFTVEKHTTPFADILPRYPTPKDMRNLYNGRKIDDLFTIPPRWQNDQKVLRPFLNSILRECLNQNPLSRPTALRLRKNIENLESLNVGKYIDLI